MRFSNLASFAATLFLGQVLGLSDAEWRSQSIYQIMTDRFATGTGDRSACSDLGEYCGGTWQGIIDQLDYIQGMGFTAIWISPVVENLNQLTTDGASYHGYWAQDIYSVNTNFGSASDLVSLSSALHSRGMYLMVDVVTNHMGYAGCGTCVDYSVYDTFNEQSYFHDFCLIDYDNETSVQVCWEGDNTVSLPDLRTEDTDVVDMWAKWIGELVSNYSIDGLRVDSARQVDEAFWSPFLEAAGIYAVGEVFAGDPSFVCGFQDYINVLNYPAYFWITQAFQNSSGSISNLYDGINSMKSDCADTTLLGSFLENHDNPRFPSYTSDMSLTKNAIGFTILQDGIPIVYQGQEQHYDGGTNPANRQVLWISDFSTSATLYQYIANVNAIRSQANYMDESYITYKANPIYQDDNTIVMRKGSVISVFSNAGADAGSYSVTLDSSDTGFTASEDVYDAIACKSYTTDSSGNLSPTITTGLPMVFIPASYTNGSYICGSTTSKRDVPKIRGRSA